MFVMVYEYFPGRFPKLRWIADRPGTTLTVGLPVAATRGQGPPKGSKKPDRPRQWSRSHGYRDCPIRSRRRSLALQEKPAPRQSCEPSIVGAHEPYLCE